MMLNARVFWLEKLSDIFIIMNGLRQGAVISQKCYICILMT